MKSYPRPRSGMSPHDVEQKFGVAKAYRMSFNESPLGASATVVEAIAEAAQDLGMYPPMGDEILRNELAETLGRDLTPNHFFTGCSGYEALELAGRALLEPGDEVIVTPPTFGVYGKVAAMQGASAVNVPLLEPDFSLDVDGILGAVNSRTRMLILCNPNNPTGTVFPAEQIDRIVRELPERVLFVADEVYHHFVEHPHFPDTLKYVLEGRNVLMIHTFSKAYGLAGLRLGYGIAKPELADAIGGLHRGFHQNKLALAGGLAALRDPQHLQRNTQAAIDGRKFICAQFEALGIRYWPSDTNFILFESPGPVDEVVEFMLRRGVIIRSPMGELAHCIRVSVSVPEGNQLFVDGLADYLAR